MNLKGGTEVEEPYVQRWECFESQVSSREAQVRLLPEHRLLLGLGEHTQGCPQEELLLEPAPPMYDIHKTY